jgi:hypothetical protein
MLVCDLHVDANTVMVRSHICFARALPFYIELDSAAPVSSKLRASAEDLSIGKGINMQCCPRQRRSKVVSHHDGFTEYTKYPKYIEFLLPYRTSRCVIYLNTLGSHHLHSDVSKRLNVSLKHGRNASSSSLRNERAQEPVALDQRRSECLFQEVICLVLSCLPFLSPRQ